MKKIASIISFILLGLIVFLFSKQSTPSENRDNINIEDYGDMISQETLKHL